jgi:hypothetical protein
MRVVLTVLALELEYGSHAAGVMKSTGLQVPIGLSHVSTQVNMFCTCICACAHGHGVCDSFDAGRGLDGTHTIGRLFTRVQWILVSAKMTMRDALFIECSIPWVEVEEEAISFLVRAVLVPGVLPILQKEYVCDDLRSSSHCLLSPEPPAKYRSKTG